MSKESLLIVLSGPSAVGKDSILDRMRAEGQPFHFTVTATTRPPRPGERDGIDYYFYTDEQFQKLVASGGFLEHAAVYAHRYGVPKAPVLAALAQGRDVIMRTDVQGAATIRREAPGAVLIFIAPPSEASLLDRLRRRDADSRDDVALRLSKVREEMAALPLFDYVVVNAEGELERAVADVGHIVRAEKLRVDRLRGERPPSASAADGDRSTQGANEVRVVDDASLRRAAPMDAELALVREQLAHLGGVWEVAPHHRGMRKWLTDHEKLMREVARQRNSLQEHRESEIPHGGG